uniref:Uncharacterized protein n=1 Tax=Panagrolaimus sp. ES5 TaxID=591445 RepID=A0AC34F580_9BILA
MMSSGTPVIFNVFAPANGGPPNSNYCTLQSVHYGTLPIKRTNSIKAAKSTEKSTPGLDQIMKWVKNKREKYKSSRRSSASAVSSSTSILKEAPPGILRNSRRDYANYYLDSLPRGHQQQQQQFYPQQFHQQQTQQQHVSRRHLGPPTMSLPPTNRQWSTLRRRSDAYYGYDPVYDEDDDVFDIRTPTQQSFDSYRDYYPTATLERLERYEPSLPRSSRRSSTEVAPVPMLHRYPAPSYIEPPIDYSCSSTSSSLNGSPNPATQKVRFQFPKPEDVQYINTTLTDEEKEVEAEESSFSPSTLQKFEKIYQKFKPNFIKKSAKKTNSIDSTEENTPSTSTSASASGSGQLENDDTDSTTSVATIHLPTKIVIEDDKIDKDEDIENDKLEGCNNVFFFGETRIDYHCHRVGNNMVVHYTSRKIPSGNGKVASKIQRQGVITDIEYGPGIVQKLREKFSRMATTVIETAQISPHAKQKKFPSVDDILSENEQRNIEQKRQEFNDQTQQEQPKPYYYFHHDTKSKQQQHVHHHELPSSPPLPSRSQSQPPPKSPPLPVETPKNEPQQQENSPRAVVEKAPLGPISALRAKFEQQAAARAHAFGIARANFGSRSQSVNTLKQYEARKEVAAILKIPPTVHSPASSTASSDQSPPPEEPRLIEHEVEEENEEEQNEKSFKDSYEQYRTQAIQDDRSNERLAFAAIQRQKMTLTLPIGSSPQQLHLQQQNQQLQQPQHQQQHQHHQKLRNPFNEVRIGKPGSTPITGPTKLKLPSVE